VNCYDTGLNGHDDDTLLAIVNKNFDLRPYAIIRDLKLLRPIYRKTAAYGHFGRNDPDFEWEKPKALQL
jgi:S-adenosylmethionine synthetase